MEKDLVVRPKMTGGSYDVLVQKCDMIGFMHQGQNGAKISFSPTDRSVGKDSARLGTIDVPHFESSDFDGFFSGVISKVKSNINSSMASQHESVKIINDFKAVVSKWKFDDFTQEISDFTSGQTTLVGNQIIGILSKSLLEVVCSQLSKCDSIDCMNGILSTVLSCDESISKKSKVAILNKSKEMGFTFDKQKNTFS